MSRVRDRTLDGTAVRRRREHLGLTRPALAQLVDVSYSYLGFLERGEMQPRDRIANDIARGLDCDVEDISTPKHRDVAA